MAAFLAAWQFRNAYRHVTSELASGRSVSIDRYQERMNSPSAMRMPETAEPGARPLAFGTDSRRHDLDALRATAMLLGVGLHCGRSFAPLPYLVQDSQQHEGFIWFFAAIHGFRMPLFFLLSGFFTAMLWRRRGLRALVQHRYRRIFLPLVLSCLTILPAVVVSSRAARWASNRTPSATQSADHPEPSDDGRARRDRLVAGPARPAGILAKLTGLNVFFHLWFLWHLCWLVAGFVVCAAIAEWLRLGTPPRALMLSPLRFVWLLPLTALLQCRMGLTSPKFGPDTASGLLPTPHVLLFYAIFFGFGAWYYLCDDRDHRLGRWWPVSLGLALLVFPAAYELSISREMGFGFREFTPEPSTQRSVAVWLQVIYAWAMTFGLIGMFRQLLRRQSAWWRYLSDASYWLYLIHFPFVILGQVFVREWPLPAIVKFAMLCTSVTLGLLLVYDRVVRYGWLGGLLNGPRIKSAERA